MLKNISLIIFIIFNYAFLSSFMEKPQLISKTSTISQETFGQNSDINNSIIFQNNIFENKEKIIYLY
jgi:hypothetical protein